MGETTRIAQSHLDQLVRYVTSHDRVELVIVSPVDLPQAIRDHGCKIKGVKDKKAGVYSAMNLGADAASGKYLYFSNVGDDFFGINVTELQYDLECFPVHVVSATGEQIFVRFPLHRLRIMPPHQGMFVKREIFCQKQFDTSLRFCADLKWYLNFKGQRRFHTSPVVANFRLGGISNQRRYLLKRKFERYSIIVKHVLSLG